MKARLTVVTEATQWQSCQCDKGWQANKPDVVCRWSNERAKPGTQRLARRKPYTAHYVLPFLNKLVVEQKQPSCCVRS